MMAELWVERKRVSEVPKPSEEEEMVRKLVSGGMEEGQIMGKPNGIRNVNF